MAEKIGILKGRSTRYNKYILEVLAKNGNPLKPWELSKQIHKEMAAKHDLPKKWEHVNWYPATQKIQSVLIRKKGGRLEDLKDKDYIEEVEGKGWFLTLKGFLTAAFLFQDFIHEIAENPLWRNPAGIDRVIKKEARRAVKKVKRGNIFTIHTKSLRKQSKKFYSQIREQGQLKGMVEQLGWLIDNFGIQLDNVDSAHLLVLLTATPKVQQIIDKIL